MPMKLRPPGKKPTGRSGQAGKGIGCDDPTPRGDGMRFRNSVAEGQLAPSEECQINQKKRQAGVA